MKKDKLIQTGKVLVTCTLTITGLGSLLPAERALGGNPRIRHGAYRGRDVLTALLAADREVAVPSLRKVEHEYQYRRRKDETTVWISPELSPGKSLRCVEMT
jgi:hypothetical protein